MTYNVFGGTLNLAQSINPVWHPGLTILSVLKSYCIQPCHTIRH